MPWRPTTVKFIPRRPFFKRNLTLNVCSTPAHSTDVVVTNEELVLVSDNASQENTNDACQPNGTNVVELSNMTNEVLINGESVANNAQDKSTVECQSNDGDVVEISNSANKVVTIEEPFSVANNDGQSNGNNETSP